MTKTAIGLFSGIAIIILTLVVVALTNLPEAEGAVAPESATTAQCSLKPVVQDQGYGIGRTVQRRVCDSAPAK
jgi:hypothetical protein